MKIKDKTILKIKGKDLIIKSRDLDYKNYIVNSKNIIIESKKHKKPKYKSVYLMEDY